MQAMTVDELRTVIAHETPPCVSIYMPTSRGGSADDKAQFAGHVREARRLLGTALPRAQVDDFMAPIDTLDLTKFFEQQLDGLALFRSRDFFSHYALPLKLEHLAVVADSFHIRPILRFLQSNQRYWLLNLSLGRVSFFKGNAMGLAPVEVPKMPRSIDDITVFEQHERVVQSHSSGSGSPIYHGQGKLERVHAEDVRAYYRAIDKALWELLREDTAPLVLVATEEHHPIFSANCRYSHLLRDGVHGNFNNAPLPELHAKAWPVVQQHLKERENEVLEHYGNSIKRRRTSDEVNSVAAAAIQGRVRELLVLRDSHLWGRMDSATGAIELHQSDGKRSAVQNPHEDDVVDDIAEAVILRGGTVYSFEKDRMPTKSPLAAVLRW